MNQVMIEYLEIAEKYVACGKNWHEIDEAWMARDPNDCIASLRMRREMVYYYSWAVPNHQALETIAKYAPIVEIGAGNGYWASLLREMGVDIIAFDILQPGPDNKYCKGPIPPYTDVIIGGAHKAKEFPDRTLFLCWPPDDDKIGDDCIKAYTGQTIIYVGEIGGCTGGYEELEKWGECIEEVQIPQWYGLHDYLSVWRKR